MDPSRERIIKAAALAKLRQIVVLLRKSEDKELITKIQTPINQLANLLGDSDAEMPRM